ncbi:hypothetical protein PC41400_07430 [Paenibacillus chitinolyticus]|uniref:Uncharacterized protein n=1 Tax=Paenibacillus chitinolyticus TaxID=79263 RepID=A0A410WT39_9BACL|nr:hypothetical protein PC41400_07430 [Paenibacillus chitinolyticus]
MPHYDAAAFFIVAHMDDWQLFMNPQATWEMSSDTVKVIFIYTSFMASCFRKFNHRLCKRETVPALCFGRILKPVVRNI